VSWRRICSYIGLVCLVSACASIPTNALKLSPTSYEDRQLQTRGYETRDELKLLIAGAGVLQDLGYAIDETEKSLGLLTASKRADAFDAGQFAGAIFLSVLGGGGQSVAIDKEQKIRASLVVSPSHNREDYFLVRITFQRVVWDTQGRVTRIESINDRDIYQGFFSKLSKAVFLEAHSL